MQFRAIRLLISALLMGIVPHSANALSETYGRYQRQEGPLFTLDILEQQISNKSLSVDQVLGLLPQEFRENYLLIRDSASLQKSQPPRTPLEIPKPRVIMYGKDGLIATFTHESLPGGSSIEMLQFKADNTWEIAEFKEGKGLERNPKKCASCHGVATRPLWEGYSCWPQAYAFNDDRLRPEHYAELTRFVGGITPKSRYAILHKPEERYQKLEYGTNNPRLVAQPNITFTSYIHSFDDLRTTALLKKHPNYDLLKYAMVSTMLQCSSELQSGYLAFFPTDLQKSIMQSTQKMSHEVSRFGQTKYRYFKHRECSESGKVQEDALFLKVLLRAFGQPSSELFTGFHPLEGSYSLDPNDYYRINLLAVNIARTDPDLKDIDIGEDYSPFNRTCKRLAEASQAAWAKRIETPKIDIDSEKGFENIKVAATFSKCITCHLNKESGAPHIPYDNAISFKNWLKENSERKDKILYRISNQAEADGKQMPPVGGLTESDKAVIQQYLKDLDLGWKQRFKDML